MRKYLLLLLLTLFSFSAIHAEVISTLSDDGTLTISGKDIPDYDIVSRWFVYRDKIKKVVIKAGVTSIGNYAFSYCDNISSITIPNSVTRIGDYAFENCRALLSITIPNSVTSIGNHAFLSCSGLTSITIPNSVTSIGNYAFWGCSGLTSITIPNSVTSIGDFAFGECGNLTSITIPNSVTSIANGVFLNCIRLTSVTIPNSVTSIGNGAFNQCYNLTSATIPNSVTSIGEQAFQLCRSLTSVTIPNSVTSIGAGAFLGCSGLTSITIPNSVTSIEHSAFRGCSSLSSITIPNYVTSIGDYAFYDCSGLSSITIPNSVTSIGDGAFHGCSKLASITIPNSVTSIGDYAFYGCSGLSSITIPNYVTSIGDDAFYGCSGLSSITIPNSVRSIGNHTFGNCKLLNSITFKGSTHPGFGEDVFMYVNKSIPIYVPSKSIEAYRNALEGFGMSNIQAITLSLKDNEAYTENSQIEEVDVTYTRNFTNTKWQALYLPFSLKYEDWKDDFEIAYINAIRQKDNNDDGKIDETILEFIKMNSGSTAPNTPYIIRAKEKGEKTLSAKNTTVYPAENNSVDCTTTTTRFTFTGIYKAITASYTFTTKQYYVLDGEKFSRASVVNYPKAYQWYMEIKSRNSSYATYNPAKEITISVLGEEEATGISQMQMENRQSSVYDINGRMVNENSLKPGMYIKNGKKIIIK